MALCSKQFLLYIATNMTKRRPRKTLSVFMVHGRLQNQAEILGEHFHLNSIMIQCTRFIYPRSFVILLPYCSALADFKGFLLNSVVLCRKRDHIFCSCPLNKSCIMRKTALLRLVIHLYWVPYLSKYT